jgi:hypothetical protein
LWRSPKRYEIYIDTLSSWQAWFHAIVYVLLPAIAIWLTRARRERLTLAALVIAPVIITAGLISSTNYYYAHLVGLPLALASAAGVSKLPALGRFVLMGVVLAAVALTFNDRLELARNSRGNPTQRDVVAMLTREVPRDSVVMMPSMYAGLLSTRPDVRVFNYKSLSLRPGWRLPPCSDLDSRLRTLLREDRRSSPPHKDVDAVYFVTYTAFIHYLLQTYEGATEQDLNCMIASPGSSQTQTRFCNRESTQCLDVFVTRHPLQ